MNIAQNVERGCCLFRNKPAIVFEGKYFTYFDLNQMANRTANGLLKLGIKRGDRVALFLPNIPEFIISYLGILKIGAIAVSVNTALKSEEVKYILDDCQAVAVITTETLFESIPQQNLPYLQHIVTALGKAVTGMTLAELMSGASPNARAIEMERDDPAAILYTSGTTGFPKGATLSHGNVISNMNSMNHNCGMSPFDKILLFLPMFHCFGQNAIFNSALNACSTIVLHRTFEPEAVLNSVADDGITMFFGVPTTFILLLDKAGKKDLTARYYFSAAAGLPVEIAQKWYEKFGVVINQGYGLTETSPLASYNHYLKFKHGSIGAPIENVEMKIVNPEDDSEVAPGEIGEIVIRGVNVMLGYWNRPDDTAKAIKNGWFHTGDIGKMDDNGYFYIVDRLKDMINTGGMKVYPTEVENVIYQHPSIREVAVYGVPDPLMGEQIWANVILKPNEVATEEEIIAFCHQRLAKYKVPSTIKLVTSIPKNPTGKILKRLLRQQQDQSTDPTPNVVAVTREKPLPAPKQVVPTQSSGSIENWIADWLVRKLAFAADSIHPSKSFADYGLDSLRAVKLAQDLGNWLQISLPATILWNFATIESLARHLASQNIPVVTEESDLPSLTQSLMINPERDAETKDLQALSDAELAKLLAQEIATLKQRKLR